jgi:hypothetical protein
VIKACQPPTLRSRYGKGENERKRIEKLSDIYVAKVAEMNGILTGKNLQRFKGDALGPLACRQSSLLLGIVDRTTRREERFLSAQADAFAGAKAEEKVGLLRSK